MIRYRAKQAVVVLNVGDYLAYFTDTPDNSDPGSRCGYCDQELDEIRRGLLQRGLRLQSDDIGLIVVREENTHC